MDEEDRNIIMADIEGTWYEPSSRPGRNNQERVNIYVTMILQLIFINPNISTMQILDTLSRSPRTESREQILRRFGGWPIFADTIGRMGPLRVGVINERPMGFPVTTRVPEGPGFGETLPDPDGYIAWWAPQTGGGVPPFLFRIRETEAHHLCRYPHQGVYTDTNSEEDSNETETHTEDT